MTVQALLIAFLYLIILLPYTLVYILYDTYYLSSPLLTELSTYTVFFSYFMILLFPFVCACSLPELKARVKNLFHRPRQTRLIAPTIQSGRTYTNDRRHN